MGTPRDPHHSVDQLQLTRSREVPTDPANQSIHHVEAHQHKQWHNDVERGRDQLGPLGDMQPMEVLIARPIVVIDRRDQHRDEDHHHPSDTQDRQSDADELEVELPQGLRLHRLAAEEANKSIAPAGLLDLDRGLAHGSYFLMEIVHGYYVG